MEEINNVDTIPQDVDVQETTQDVTSVDTTVEESTPTEQPQTFKVKHLKEEKEISYDEAPTYIQKGLDYDRVKTKYEETKPVLDFIEGLAKQNSMSVNEYMTAVKEYEKQQEIEALANQNSLNPELAAELYLLRQERAERTRLQQEQESKAKQEKEYIDFLDTFPNVSAETVPSEVWKIKQDNPNISLTDAYYRHQYNVLQNKMKAEEVNQRNAEASTGSVSTDGDISADFISFEQFESKKSDQNWMKKNLDRILKSREKW